MNIPKASNELKDEIFESFLDISKLFFPDVKKINKIERGIYNSFDNKTEIWDFFDKFHSESSEKNGDFRFYLFYLEENSGKQIKVGFTYIAFENDIDCDYFLDPSSFEGVNDKELLLVKISKIRESEKYNRELKKIKYTDTDKKVHNLLELDKK